MFSQSQIAYDLVAQHTEERAKQAVTLVACRQARAASRSGKFRLFVGEALISTGRRVQGRNLQSLSALVPTAGES
jgi:hypothetical protein